VGPAFMQAPDLDLVLDQAVDDLQGSGYAFPTEPVQGPVQQDLGPAGPSVRTGSMMLPSTPNIEAGVVSRG